MSERTESCIALYPSSGNDKSWYLFNVVTKKRIVRSRYDVLPISEAGLTYLDNMKSAEVDEILKSFELEPDFIISEGFNVDDFVLPSANAGVEHFFVAEEEITAETSEENNDEASLEEGNYEIYHDYHEIRISTPIPALGEDHEDHDDVGNIIDEIIPTPDVGLVKNIGGDFGEVIDDIIDAVDDLGDIDPEYHMLDVAAPTLSIGGVEQEENIDLGDVLDTLMSHVDEDEEERDTRGDKRKSTDDINAPRSKYHQIDVDEEKRKYGSHEKAKRRRNYFIKTRISNCFLNVISYVTV